MAGQSHTESFRSLFENAPLAYQSLDGEGRLLLVNHAWLELLGYEADEVLGRSVAEFMTPESVELLAVRFANFKACGVVQGKEFEMLHRDGTIVPIRVDGRIAVDERGDFRQTHCILMDLREERSARQALVESERKYRHLVELAHEGIWQIDAEAYTVFVNPAMAAMLGYTEEEMLGRHLFDFMDERGKQIATANIERRKQGKAESHDFEFRHRDGRRVLVTMATRPLTDDQGEYAGAIAGVLDMTERRRDEERLRVSTEHLHDAERIGGFGYWNWKLDEQRIWTSPGLCRLFGVDPDTFDPTFEKFMAHLHPADRPELQRVIEAHLATGEPYETQFRVLHDDGTVVTLHVVGRPLHNADGEIYALNGVAQDISATLAQEATLRRNEAHLNEAQRLALMGSWTYDLPEDRGWWSDGMYRLHGLDPADGVPRGESYFDRVVEEDRARFLKIYQESMETGRPYETAYRIVRADGVERRLQSHGRPVLDEQGVVVGLQGFSQDVTERHAAEEERRDLEQQLLHRQKLESLGVLAGGLAHDFNNLLQAVLGNTHLVLQDTPADAASLHCLLEVETAARRATDLCRQLLAYAGKGRLVFDDVELAPLIREMVEILDVTISKKADLDLRLPEQSVVVRADATQLNQIVMNLVTNASEAMSGPGGRIVVSMDVVALAESHLSARYPGAGLPAGDYALLRVSDDGCGMDEETRLRLFDPFFSTKFTGRGLGMAAVQGIIKRHDGGIRVESAPNEGTIVEVVLPIHQVEGEARAEPAPVAAAAGDRPFSGRTILLADDERIVLDLGVRMLERLGCRVLTAEDGLSAVDLFREHRDAIDCVVLDLTMPRMDGHEAFRLIRAEKPDVRVVISSGYSSESVSASFGDAPPDVFLAKPYELTTLQEALEELL